MTQTTCGNLTPVQSLRSWPNRLFGARPSFLAVFVAVACVTGCESESASSPSGDQKAPAAKADPVVAAPKPMTEDEFAQRTEHWRDRITEDVNLANSASFFEAKAELTRVGNEAKDKHLRANASLLLGLLFEGRRDVKAAIAQYEHAAKLVPDDAGPSMALALALAADQRFADAAEAQKTATKLDPDNLENWLVLGELLVKSGDKDAAVSAYVDYETRRKGLIDGLTLKNKQGAYQIGVQDRVGCAEALASATDQGTAIALTYAFKSDPEPEVRAAVAMVMGVQRLAVYKPVLLDTLPTVKHAELKESIAWALGEIDRDPVSPKRPELPPEVAEAAKAPAGEAAKAPEGEAAKPTEAPASP